MDSFAPDRDGYSDRLSCPVLINGNLIIFGGQDEQTQITVVYPLGSQRIGSLPFTFENGICINNNGTVYLCYSAVPESTKNLCRIRCVKNYQKL